ncbi:MAG: molybdate ABC transporter substrate-binding protein [Rhizomicrobium sp.]
MPRFRLILAVLLLAACAMPAAAADVTVFAAASLADSLKEIAIDFQRATGKDVAVSFAASSTLARQIEESSGADIFISADRQWMDYLDRKGLIARRENLLGNRLVLIAPKDSTVKLTIASHFALVAALHGGRLAIANPQSVPAGIYGRAALVSLGVWNSMASHLAQAEDVRMALAYVARGETPLGIVYATDAKAEPRVKVVGVFPESSHLPILYPVGLVKGAKPGAKDFFRYLSSAPARRVFKKDGFTVLAK